MVTIILWRCFYDRPDGGKTVDSAVEIFPAYVRERDISADVFHFRQYHSRKIRRRGRSCSSWCVLSYNNDIYGVCSGKQCWLLCGDISILWRKRVLKGKNCVNYYYNFMYDTCDSADSFWTCVLYSSYENDKHAR